MGQHTIDLTSEPRPHWEIIVAKRAQNPTFTFDHQLEALSKPSLHVIGI
jgi:hypothetical protein